MQRYLFRVQYTYSDDTVSYESVCIRAETAAAASTDAVEATDRYAAAASASRTYTVLLVTADV